MTRHYCTEDPTQTNFADINITIVTQLDTTDSKTHQIPVSPIASLPLPWHDRQSYSTEDQAWSNVADSTFKWHLTSGIVSAETTTSRRRHNAAARDKGVNAHENQCSTNSCILKLLTLSYSSGWAMELRQMNVFAALINRSVNQSIQSSQQLIQVYSLYQCMCPPPPHSLDSL